MGGLTAEERRAIEDLSRRVETGDYYAILGVQKDCSPAELKRAYYDLSRRFHPDRFYRRDVDDWREELESVFTGINISFEVLSDDVQRRRFDLETAKKEEGGGSLSERRGRSTGDRPTRSTKRKHSSREPEVKSPPPVNESAEPAPQARTEPAKEARAEPPNQAPPPPEEPQPAPGSEESESRSTMDSSDDTGSRRMSTYARHRDRLRRSRSRSQSRSDERKSRREEGSSSKNTRTKSSMDKAVRGKISARFEKAKACHKDGLEAIENENWVKAAASLYMAHQYAPKNDEYKKLWEEAQVHANRARAAQFVSLAENAESFRNIREAMENYKKATECDPPDGVAHYRFGQLLNEYSGDPRGALQQFRHAVMKEPENVRYRVALADLYLAQKMTKNAIREYQKAVELDPKNKVAKTALRKLRF